MAQPFTSASATTKKQTLCEYLAQRLCAGRVRSAVGQSGDDRAALKGSCPWLFTYDGEKMRFVTDFIWRSPLGLRINARTRERDDDRRWVKIAATDEAQRRFLYLRITTELWETQFFDHVSL